jgi:hypothetical protein
MGQGAGSRNQKPLNFPLLAHCFLLHQADGPEIPAPTFRGEASSRRAGREPYSTNLIVQKSADKSSSTR